MELQVEDALPLDAEGVPIKACKAAAAARLLHGWRCHSSIALQQNTLPSIWCKAGLSNRPTHSDSPAQVMCYLMHELCNDRK